MILNNKVKFSKILVAVICVSHYEIFLVNDCHWYPMFWILSDTILWF